MKLDWDFLKVKLHVFCFNFLFLSHKYVSDGSNAHYTPLLKCETREASLGAALDISHVHRSAISSSAGYSGQEDRAALQHNHSSGKLV